jgi:hypothetical protein
MSEEQHHDVMKIVQQANGVWERAFLNTNDNGVLVDMCELPHEIVFELESLVHLASTQLQFQETSMAELNEIANATGEASKRWDAKIDSKRVFDRAEELVRRHLYRADPPKDSGATRKRNASKKNFLCTTKKIDVFEPQMNLLDEEEVPPDSSSSHDASPVR